MEERFRSCENVLGRHPKQHGTSRAMSEPEGLPGKENLTSEHMADIDKILDNKPEPYAGFGGAGMRQIVTI